MQNHVARREVQRCDDPFGIPACFYWSVDEVADWVESIGYGKYKENFRSHFINGRKLLTVDACTLPQLGIVHFGDILDLAGQIRNLLCGRRRKPYAHPSLAISFKKDHHYPYAPLDDLHPDYKFERWYPSAVQPKQIWLSHPEFVANASTEMSCFGVKDCDCKPLSEKETFCPLETCIVQYSFETERRQEIQPEIYVEAIAKIIRYQLGVDNHKKFNPYRKRGIYMNSRKEQGKRSPSLTYTQFMARNELTLDAKARYFKTRGFYYSGWIMDPKWNRKLLEEENEVNQAITCFHLSSKKFKIGDSIQERLNYATLREVNNDVNDRANNERRKTSSHYKTLAEDEHDRRMEDKAKLNENVHDRRDGPFLPIIFCWKQMNPSTGYPPLKVEIKDNMCGI